MVNDTQCTHTTHNIFIEHLYSICTVLQHQQYCKKLGYGWVTFYITIGLPIFLWYRKQYKTVLKACILNTTVAAGFMTKFTCLKSKPAVQTNTSYQVTSLIEYRNTARAFQTASLLPTPCCALFLFGCFNIAMAARSTNNSNNKHYILYPSICTFQGTKCLFVCLPKLDQAKSSNSLSMPS